MNLISVEEIRQQLDNINCSYREKKSWTESIICTDESYIPSSRVCQNGLTDDSIGSITKPLSTGQRIIVVHTGCGIGFISIAFYHENLIHPAVITRWNPDTFMKWALNKRILNLSLHSVILMDNLFGNMITWKWLKYQTVN